MSQGKPGRQFFKVGGLFFMAWGLSPSVSLVATGLWLGQAGIPGLDSEDFPGAHLKVVLGISCLILYPWSILLVGELGQRARSRFLVAIPLTLVALASNMFLAVGGCAMVDLANEVGSFL